MRESSTEYADTHMLGLQVSSSIDVFYDGILIAASIPLADGTLTDNDSQDVARDTNLTVPRFVSLDDGITTTDLLPRDELDPLECYGQQAAIQYEVVLPSGRVESFSLGLARLQSWDENETGGIELNGAGLLLEAQEDRLLRAVQIPTGTSFPTAVDRLVGDIIPVVIDEALPVRNTGAFTFEEDRLAGLRMLLDAWPARAYVDDQGVLQVTVPYNDLTDPIVSTVRDGENGTLVDAPKGNNREGRYNGVVASGEGPDDMKPVLGAAYITEGPLQWGGPFGNVPYGMASPLLTTNAQADAAAATRLQNLQRAARPRTLTMVPDVRLQTGDVIAVESDDEPTMVLRIQSIDFPVTFEGVMTVSGGVIADRNA